MHDPPQANTAPLAGSPCRGDRFPRSMQEPRPRSRHLHAGHHLANQQAPARLIPRLQSIPGFDVNLFLRHVISGSLALAFVIHTCRAHGATFPRRSPPRLLTAAARGGLRPPPAQRPRRATSQQRQLLHLLHSTAFRIRIFYIQPPSTFVAHLWTSSGRVRRMIGRFFFRGECKRVCSARCAGRSPLGCHMCS